MQEPIYLYPPNQIVKAECFAYRTARLTGQIRSVLRNSPQARTFESTLRTSAGQLHSRNHTVYVVTTVADGVHYYMVSDHLIKEGEGYIEEAW